MHNNTTTIDQQVNHINSLKVSSYYPWLVWLLGASFFFYKYLVQVSPSVMTSDLMRSFNINATGLGNLSACYFYAYLIMQIPVGILLDRYSPRLLTAFAIIICALGTLLFSQANSLFVAAISRAIIGFGAAFAAVSCFKLAALWFPPKRFAMISGMCMTAAMLGAVGGQVPLSALVGNYGWRSALQIVAMIGIALSVLYLFCVRDVNNKNSKNKTSNDTPAFSHLFAIVKSKQAWLLSLYSGLAFAPVSVFGGLWGVPFLQHANTISRDQAAMAISWIFIGFAVGAPISGWFSDLIARRKPVMFVGSSLALLSLSLVIYFPVQHILVLSALLFMFGFGASGFFTSFAMIKDIFSVTLAATVLGFMNTFDSVCEALYEPLVGVVLDLLWGGTVQQGVHVFTTGTYQIALTLLPLCLFIAIMLLYFIEETYCRSKA